MSLKYFLRIFHDAVQGIIYAHHWMNRWHSILTLILGSLMKEIVLYLHDNELKQVLYSSSIGCVLLVAKEFLACAPMYSYKKS